MLVYILLAVYILCLYSAYKGAKRDHEQDLGKYPMKDEEIPNN